MVENLSKSKSRVEKRRKGLIRFYKILVDLTIGN